MLGNISYNTDIEDKIKSMQSSSAQGAGASGGGSDFDAYFVDAGKFVIDKDKASIGMLQRVFKIGFNRAARIVDQLEEAGVVGAEEGTKPRRILMSLEQFENYIEENL
jgi:S-DNA-T family DNA segregation ATPase FtsK/SpoIIIE